MAGDVRALVEGRDIAAGLDALTQRWIGGDGRIVPPPVAPAGITVRRSGLAAAQLIEQLDLEDLTGRVPTTTVYVALGAEAWPDAPADRRVDLRAGGLDATMFAAPTPATGDWFVALGTRADCRASGSTTDGTPEQAARLARVLDALATVSNDIALVAVRGRRPRGARGRAGAGGGDRPRDARHAAVAGLAHRARRAAHRRCAAVAASAAAARWRGAGRRGPRTRPRTGAGDDGARPAAPTRRPTCARPPCHRSRRAPGSRCARSSARCRPARWARRSRPSWRLGSPRAPVCARRTPLPRADRRACRTALAAAGRWHRHRGRHRQRDAAAVRLDEPATGTDLSRVLRVQLRIGDRLGWLASTPELELRAVSADLTLPLDGASPGEARLVLHDARVFGQSWEALALGNVAGARAGAAGGARAARRRGAAAHRRPRRHARRWHWPTCSPRSASSGANGGVVGDAVDQLVHDPAGLVRQRLASAGAQVAAAVNSLLGPLGASIDLPSHTVRVQGGDSTTRPLWLACRRQRLADGAGRPAAFRPRCGAAHRGRPAAAARPEPAARHAALAPAGRRAATPSALWPAPDGQALARMLAQAAPSLGGHAALELMRRADESARPLIDACSTRWACSAGTVGDAERAIRPLAGLLSRPGRLAAQRRFAGREPGEDPGLFDALRPLMGLNGAQRHAPRAGQRREARGGGRRPRRAPRHCRSTRAPGRRPTA